jgi:hypothetical protein
MVAHWVRICNYWLHVEEMPRRSNKEPAMPTDATSTTPLAATSDDYTHEMTVHAPPDRIIAAVTDGELICGWWTASTSWTRVGTELRLLRLDSPFVSFTIDDKPDANEVSWTVTGCVMEDWLGTRPTFTVRPIDDDTSIVVFRHIGLRPALECFDQCRAGWGHFMPSLHQFLETGVGRPNEPRVPSA